MNFRLRSLLVIGYLYQLLKKGTTRRYALANGAEYYDTSYTPQHSPRGAVAGCGVLVGFSFIFIYCSFNSTRETDSCYNARVGKPSIR